ncbi:MAG TPA: hypothetical protein DIW30_02735 [Bacteroidales bacterium]|nr:hypothetical protein [Bacteroidales bacterium]
MQIATISQDIPQYDLVSGTKSCIFAKCRGQRLIPFIRNKRLFGFCKHLKNIRGRRQIITTKFQQQATKRQTSKLP